MSLIFKQFSYSGMGTINSLTSDKFWLEFLRFMTKTPANGGPGWILKAYGLGRTNQTGAIKGFQLNGNFDVDTVFSDGTNFTGTNTISACGSWFILQEPATNRNYRREFLIHRANRDNYYTTNFLDYSDTMAYANIYYSAQGFLTTATGNGFNSADVTGINPPIAYDMMTLTHHNSYRNPGDFSWNWVNPQSGSYLKGCFTQRNAGDYQNTPWQYVLCASDNSSSEGYGWYLLSYVKNYMAVNHFMCYDPLVSGTYDSSMLDPVVLHSEYTDLMNSSIDYGIFQRVGGFMYSNAHGYSDGSNYGYHACWAKRPATFTSKSDTTNQTNTTYTAQICRVNSYPAQRGGTLPQPLNGKDTLLPMPFVLYNYPGLSTNNFFVGISSMVKFNLQRNLSNMQTVNVSTLRDHIHIGVYNNNSSAIVLPWDGSIPAI
jgi:hypothetical protein